MFQGWQPKNYKGVNDEIKQQHMKTKDMNFKGKLGYFWDYYKIHTLVFIFAVIMVTTLIRDIVSNQDYCFYGVMLNAAGLDGELMEASFAEFAELDSENYRCFIDTSSTLSYQNQTGYDMATMQKIMAMVQSKELDALIFNDQVFANYAFSEAFLDLRTVFSDEELAGYKDYIYYVDYEVIRQANEAETNGDILLEEYEALHTATAEAITADVESHKHPENMADPIPVGIIIDNSPFAIKTSSYYQSIPIYGICATSQRTDTAKKYLDFLWDENIPFEGMGFSF